MNEIAINLKPRGSPKWGDARLAGFRLIPDVLFIKQQAPGLDSVVPLNGSSMTMMSAPRPVGTLPSRGCDPRALGRSLELGYRLMPRREGETRALCVSYAQDLADKLSRDCRRIVAVD
jgi:hypothetical protein